MIFDSKRRQATEAEADTARHLAIMHVQAGNDPFGDHGTD